MNQKDLIVKLFGNNDFRMTYIEDYQHEIFTEITDSLKDDLSKMLPSLTEDELISIQEMTDGYLLRFHEYGFQLGIDMICSLLGMGAPFKDFKK